MAIFTKYSVMLPSYVTRTGGVVYDQSQLQHKIFRNFYQNLISCLNIAITKVDAFNYLGILLDSNLSWKSHTDMLVLKISTLIGVLHRVKKYFPKSILITIYKSLITPHLNYGPLYGGAIDKAV